MGPQSLILFLHSSNEYAQLGGKKTIQPADVIAALKDNEFESFIPRLEAELKSKLPSFAMRSEFYAPKVHFDPVSFI